MNNTGFIAWVIWWFILHTEILQSPLLQCFAHRNCHSCVENWITLLQFNVLPCRRQKKANRLGLAFKVLVELASIERWLETLVN